MKDTIKEQFEGLFTQERYDGSYHGADGFRTAASEEASSSFGALTGGRMQWCQVHGDVKNVVSRANFEPYPHWPELYDCCKRVLRAQTDLRRQFFGDATLARIMSDVMSLLRVRHNANAPKCWLPIMNALRASDK
jgi:hypothetical protein